MALVLAQASNLAAPAPYAPNIEGCLANDQPSIRRIAEDSVLFCGTITHESIARFQEILRPTDQTLKITSLGGDLDAPLALAEIVRDHALKVIVVGPCLSGCASYVFIAGAERRVLPGGVVALHNTNTSALRLAHIVQGAILPRRDLPLERRAEREQALYLSLNIDPRLLLEPQIRLETHCVETRASNAITGETQYEIYTRFGFWVPTRNQWRSFGVNFTGFAARNRNEAQQVLEHTIPENFRPGLSVAFDPRLLANPIQDSLGRIGRCVPR